MTQTATEETQRTELGTNPPAVRPIPFLLGATAGAALMYLLDPDRRRTRWALLRDRTAGMARRAGRRTQRLGRRAAGEVYGVRQKVTHLRPEDEEIPNDPDLVQRVETELFRDPDIPKGAININAEDGKIVLRGQVNRLDLIGAIERAVRKVHGVHEVENLLHLPNTPAPNKAPPLHATQGETHVTP